jgi:hypothetical protein
LDTTRSYLAFRAGLGSLYGTHFQDPHFSSAGISTHALPNTSFPLWVRKEQIDVQSRLFHWLCVAAPDCVVRRKLTIAVCIYLYLTINLLPMTSQPRCLPGPRFHPGTFVCLSICRRCPPTEVPARSSVSSRHIRTRSDGGSPWGYAAATAERIATTAASSTGIDSAFRSVTRSCRLSLA